MSVRGDSKKRRGTGGAGSVAAHAFYVYCVGERGALARLLEGELPAAIESGASIDVIEGGELAAVVSRVPLTDYDEDALQTRLKDAAWTATRAMRHEQLVEYFAARTSVVPLRFGTIYFERTGVEQMLAERDAELRRIVERLRGREEWGVNVYCDRVKLRDKIASVSPRLRELSEQAALAAPGQSYLLRKKIDAMRADELRAETKRVASEIEDALAAACEAVTRLRVLKEEATEHGELVAKLAFLVERQRFDAFRDAAERLAAAHGDAGFQIELTGPWPPYNFASGA
ncbi:MAG TPA: GvpL/GvpF family gas vesicle protein [Pyrinomonadaceae bacterium]|jgi:hypothetical protein